MGSLPGESRTIDPNGGMTMHDRFRAKCLQKFGAEFDLTECYYLLVSVYKLELSGIQGCEPIGTAPKVTHNPEFYSDCSSVERHIAQYAVPLLQILCLFGNMLNLLIYRLPYFHGSSAVYFLRAKAIANIIFVESRTLEVIHAWLYVIDDSYIHKWFEMLYWHTRPFIITIANISGTLSTWMTLYITIETVICVLMPFSFRKYCTRKKTLWLLIGSVITSISLHLIFLCTHEVKTKLFLHDSVLLPATVTTTSPPTTVISAALMTPIKQQGSVSGNATKITARHLNNPTTNSNFVLFNTINHTQTRESATTNINETKFIKTCWKLTQSYSMQPIPELLTNVIYEKIYYWLQMMASIVLPTLAMLLCSVLIVTQFTFKELGESFSQRRRCVIRLTVATTLSHLLLEGPALLTFGAVASKGAFVQHHNREICMINHANNLLSVINATIPFFVFLACNQQFRQMSAIFLHFRSSDGSKRHKKFSTTLYNSAMPQTQIPSPRHPTISSIEEKEKPSKPSGPLLRAISTPISDIENFDEPQAIKTKSKKSTPKSNSLKQMTYSNHFTTAPLKTAKLDGSCIILNRCHPEHQPLIPANSTENKECDYVNEVTQGTIDSTTIIDENAKLTIDKNTSTFL